MTYLLLPLLSQRLASGAGHGDVNFWIQKHNDLTELVKDYQDREKELNMDLQEANDDKATLERDNSELKRQNKELKLEVSIHFMVTRLIEYLNLLVHAGKHVIESSNRRSRCFLKACSGQASMHLDHDFQAIHASTPLNEAKP